MNCTLVLVTEHQNQFNFSIKSDSTKLYISSPTLGVSGGISLDDAKLLRRWLDYAIQEKELEECRIPQPTT